MSCHYPSCMMGGGSCPYEVECNKRDEQAWQLREERRLLDLEEQKARIAWLKAKTKEMGWSVKNEQP